MQHHYRDPPQAAIIIKQPTTTAITNNFWWRAANVNGLLSPAPSLPITWLTLHQYEWLLCFCSNWVRLHSTTSALFFCASMRSLIRSLVRLSLTAPSQRGDVVFVVACARFCFGLRVAHFGDMGGIFAAVSRVAYFSFIHLRRALCRLRHFLLETLEIRDGLVIVFGKTKKMNTKFEIFWSMHIVLS